MMKRAASLFIIVASFFSGVTLWAGDGSNPAPKAAVSSDPSPVLNRSDLEGIEEIVFAVRKRGIDGHWYANFGYYASSPDDRPFHPHAGGRLDVLNLKTGGIRTLFEDKKGSVRDPFVDYDAQKILFSYLPADEEHYHLYEIRLDGTGLRQITSGPWDDIEPIYLPDGDILFCSSRAKRWVQCWLVQVATIHRCGPDGDDIRPLSCNAEQDNTPWVLPNGQILYMRWEYVDRNEVSYHHLWTMNPDGTRQTVYYGNQKPGITMIDAKPVPGTDRVIASFSSGHGHQEHYGVLALLDAKLGPDVEENIELIPNPDTPGEFSNVYADPWAFSENLFMAAHYSELRLIDRSGDYEVLHRLSPEEAKGEYWIGEPRPVMKREREPIVADSTDPSKAVGTLILTNIYSGRRMKGVPKGTVKELLLLETLPKPIHYSGWMEQMSHRGTFTLERILGTVPVTPEGAACFEVPANRPVFFIAMDHEGRAVKRMHSFTSVMPGETTSCVGCHEVRTETTSNDYRNELFALIKKGPDPITPVEGVPEVFDYPRDIQPILDRHCLECHNPRRSDGGVDLSGSWTPLYTHSYMELGIREMFGDNRNRAESDFPPYAIGSCASSLYRMIEEEHAGVRLSADEKKRIHYWLEAGANYAGTYAANACGQIGWYYTEVNQNDDRDWPETAAMEETIRRRCDVCHGGENRRSDGTPGFIPHRLSEDEPGKHLLDGYVKRNLVFDLTRPEDSKVLLAPLSPDAGGLGLCKPFNKTGGGKEIDASGTDASGTGGGNGTDADAKPVFADRDDPDYRAILAGIRRGRDYILHESNRFGMTRFVPAPSYAREMIRYGVLPPDHDVSTPIDPYRIDEEYWKSFWYRPDAPPSPTPPVETDP